MFRIFFYCSIFLAILPLRSMGDKPIGRLSHAIKHVRTQKKRDGTKDIPGLVPDKNIVISKPLTIEPRFNHDILAFLTSHICKIENTKIKLICKSIIRFSWVNRTLYHYYSNDKTIQRMINLLAIHHNRSDYFIAIILNQTIRQKMSDLISIIKVNRPSTKNDWSDPWYLNATFATQNDSIKGLVPHQTLLLMATSDLNVEGVKTLLDAGAPCNHDRCPNPIAVLAIPSFEYESTQNQKNKNDILKLLLEAKINPDSRYTITMPTCLHTAIKNKDMQQARLLLEYGANPYIFQFNNSYNTGFNYHTGEVIEWQHIPFQDFKKIAHELPLNAQYLEFDNSKEPWKQNAFHFVSHYSEDEQKYTKDWLKIMYDEIQEKNKSQS